MRILPLPSLKSTLVSSQTWRVFWEFSLYKVWKALWFHLDCEKRSENSHLTKCEEHFSFVLNMKNIMRILTLPSVKSTLVSSWTWRAFCEFSLYQVWGALWFHLEHEEHSEKSHFTKCEEHFSFVSNVKNVLRILPLPSVKSTLVSSLTWRTIWEFSFYQVWRALWSRLERKKYL